MVEIGFFLLSFAFLLSVYGIVAGFIGIFHPRMGLGQSANHALISVFFCVFLASLVLWNGIFFHDFSIRYVYLHSAVNMPPWYLFTSFWSALEGSHMLWTLLMSAVVCISLLFMRKKNAEFLPGIQITYGFSLTFMLLLSVTWSAPFDRLFPAGSFGQGMNPLLQNFYMSIHPPILFTGYSLLAVPFAYGISALIYGKITPEWVISVRNYTLVAWCFLLCAITLGGKWAYMELGWGGYWAWDPVENSSLLPLIAVTASLHSFIMYKKTQRLGKLSLFLILFAYILTFQGTFLTRSGIISSVHSFAQSEIGPAYLVWIFILCTGSLSLLFFRKDFLAPPHSTTLWKISRESTIVFLLFFLLFLLALVFVGTTLPFIVDVLSGTRLSIQQPFYNFFAPWICLGILSLLGIGNLLRWKSKKIEEPILSLFIPGLFAVLLTFLIYFKVRTADFLFLTIYCVGLWQIGILISDVFLKIRKNNGNPFVLLKFNRAYLGSVIVHIGFIFLMLGFLGNGSGKSTYVTLKQGQSTPFQNYSLTYDGMSFENPYNEKRIQAHIQLKNLFTEKEITVNPQKSKFSNSEQWFNEVGVYSTVFYDIYVVLASFDLGKNTVTLKVNVNPTVKVVWTSVVIMLFGALFALTHRYKPFQLGEQGSTLMESEKTKLRAKRPLNLPYTLAKGALLFLFGGICLFGLSGQLFAKEALPTQTSVIKFDQKYLDTAKELRCPTCQGLSILESETPQSRAMRIEVQKLLGAGKTKEDVISYFRKRYGSWILRTPDTKTVPGFLIWMCTISVLFLGPFFVFFMMSFNNRKSQRHQKIQKEILALLTEQKGARHER